MEQPQVKLITELRLGHVLRLAKRLGCESLDSLDVASPESIAELVYVLAGEPPDRTPMDVADAIPIGELAKITASLKGALTGPKNPAARGQRPRPGR